MGIQNLRLPENPWSLPDTLICSSPSHCCSVLQVKHLAESLDCSLSFSPTPNPPASWWALRLRCSPNLNPSHHLTASGAACPAHISVPYLCQCDDTSGTPRFYSAVNSLTSSLVIFFKVNLFLFFFFLSAMDSYHKLKNKKKSCFYAMADRTYMGLWGLVSVCLSYLPSLAHCVPAPLAFILWL